MESKSRKAEGELQTLEVLQQRYRVQSHIHEGVCNRMGWKNGKMVTEQEYQEAVDSFLKKGMGDRV